MFTDEGEALVWTFSFLFSFHQLSVPLSGEGWEGQLLEYYRLAKRVRAADRLYIYRRQGFLRVQEPILSTMKEGRLGTDGKPPPEAASNAVTFGSSLLTLLISGS